MTTITINERTKAGKSLLELAKILSASNKGVFIDTGLKKPAVTNEKSSYNPKFVATIKRRISLEKFTPINTKSIWESIK